MVHLPFADRVEAGRLLAKELLSRNAGENAVVLALARGGVPVGFAVADRLHLALDVIVARKLGVPWQPELAMGAIAGTARILDERMIVELGIADEDVEDITRREQAEMARREQLYRGGKPALDLNGRTAILVDDGLATGSTMVAAVRHAGKLNAAKVIVAVPVGSAQACGRLAREAHEVVCLAIPEAFYAVGEWYRDFRQVSDTEVQHLLVESGHKIKTLNAV
ncbi:MAG TPA: phosphoribosyltransferase [Bryobacteraceae bacterium]|jgi:putative phosphoribosyl transferase|nr:phosphoribosyltransferase [Bryobacteraceae bacterium]